MQTGKRQRRGSIEGGLVEQQLQREAACGAECEQARVRAAGNRSGASLPSACGAAAPTAWPRWNGRHKNAKLEGHVWRARRAARGKGHGYRPRGQRRQGWRRARLRRGCLDCCRRHRARLGRLAATLHADGARVRPHAPRAAAVEGEQRAAPQKRPKLGDGSRLVCPLARNGLDDEAELERVARAGGRGPLCRYFRRRRRCGRVRVHRRRRGGESVASTFAADSANGTGAVRVAGATRRRTRARTPAPLDPELKRRQKRLKVTARGGRDTVCARVRGSRRLLGERNELCLRARARAQRAGLVTRRTQRQAQPVAFTLEAREARRELRNERGAVRVRAVRVRARCVARVDGAASDASQARPRT